MITIKVWMIIVAIIYLIGLYITIKDKDYVFKPKYGDPVYKFIIPVFFIAINVIGLVFLILSGIILSLEWIFNNPQVVHFLNYQIYP